MIDYAMAVVKMPQNKRIDYSVTVVGVSSDIIGSMVTISTRRVPGAGTSGGKARILVGRNRRSIVEKFAKVVGGVNHGSGGMGSSRGGPNYVESTVEIAKQNVRVRTSSECSGLREKSYTLFGVFTGGSVQNNEPKGQLIAVEIDNKKPRRSENGVQTAGRKKAVLAPDGKGGGKREPGFAAVAAAITTR
jgi:hypothetical protein